MSWTQGLTERKDLPEKFVEWADSISEHRNSQLGCVIWDGIEPKEFQLDYYTKDTEEYMGSMSVKLKETKDS